MTRPVSAIYLTEFRDLSEQLASSINRGVERCTSSPQLFFRADDIGIPSKSFSHLIQCFTTHAAPLCLAAVPVWTTKDRLQQLRREVTARSTQWFWHQHGYAHYNHETKGKKQEFGDSRTADSINSNLKKGKNRLEELLGKDFHPVFTPPWNRCNETTLKSLAANGFIAVSRSLGVLPYATFLPDFQVNVDLHTRKETDPQSGLHNFLAELEDGLASGRCGIMLHHQRMNRRSFHFLDTLLEEISKNSPIGTVHFGDLLKRN